ncbi:DUF3307 domain-containing protein [Sinomicrobium weinanense]|uniref:DUF3307 domain-containing protein n=1 Tax=Sinomicrobium weinanense TaxID=2842200 RepID=A0A926JSH4_9FLAO|nr:DUF3307 domain-containing protein [Sinomicrobium weinanense]MBC9796695.1 DUF3307 domain-containing protein [Sinomicrobium weinanense]MBU3123030.1 DUF3307 domain-containing protein [Sinomicrobium weinanense]
MVILLKLLLAHLIGDFILQTDRGVKEKEEKKLASGKLYLHILIHILLVFLFLWDSRLWYAALIIGGTHFIIDAAKLLLQTPKTKRLFFYIDQLLHLLVIVAVWCLIQGYIPAFSLSEKQLLLLTGGLFLTFPTSIIIKTTISVYTPKTDLEKDDSLENAGRYIGILERLLVFIFIATGHWEGVGFLIAAKSIFRFSDLTQAKDRKLTEYILIGTLLSFGTAIVVAIVCTSFLL